ncbi:MAG: helix-turn-helix domain-containing protein [Thermoproteaceae archaeon]|nr:helix-turn-helix domain-containing protein [Thermoproteaceae archaeon]
MMWEQYFYKLTDRQRVEIVKCLVESLGVSIADIARAAGVSKMAVSNWVRGVNAPQVDRLIALHSAMPETVARCLPEPPAGRLEVDMALSTLARAARDPALRDYILQQLETLFPGQIRRQLAYRVEREDIEAFRGRLLSEGVAKETADEYLRYLVKFLSAAGWVISPDTVQRVYAIETPHVRRKTAVALKRFIDTVVRTREPQLAALLYDAFTTPKVKARNNFRVPSLEEVKKVWEETSKISPCAAAVWGIMAETGVRLDHLLRARLDGLQLDRRRLLLGETEGPKRQPLVFLTEGAARYLRDVYLPWRERFCRMLRLSTDKLFPCREETLYQWLREARQRAGLPWLEPKLLRKFVAQWLLDRGVDVADIAVLQGRSLPGGLAVTVEHYIADFERRLRAVFEQHALRVFP